MSVKRKEKTVKWKEKKKVLRKNGYPRRHNASCPRRGFDCNQEIDDNPECTCGVYERRAEVKRALEITKSEPVRNTSDKVRVEVLRAFVAGRERHCIAIEGVRVTSAPKTVWTPVLVEHVDPLDIQLAMQGRSVKDLELVDAGTLKKPLGLGTHRFENNPEERRFAKAWVETCRQNRTLDYLMLPPDDSQHGVRSVTLRDHIVAATVIQWLGSPVGSFFLNELGYFRKNAR